MKAVRILLLLLLSMILLLLLQQYFFAPRYLFSAGLPFHGPRIENPYNSLEESKWIKCNFHAHSEAWAGLTNGHGSAQDIFRVYDSLQYRIRCVSNYNQIDKYFRGRADYIPAYEHGYNILKTHQLVLGSEKVRWLDYIFPQSLSNKQDILKRLSADPAALVILNHPALRGGYSCSDLRMLNGFNCIEILNPRALSLKQWDSALSAGSRVWAVGNDDVHDVLKKGGAGRMCTFVNSDPNRDAVLRALRDGKCFAVQIAPGQSPAAIPVLKFLQIRGNSVILKMSSKAKEIRFTGQNGRALASYKDTDTASYVLKKEDHYARAALSFSNGTIIYLNPVFYSGEQWQAGLAPVFNQKKTFLFRLIGAFILVAWLNLLHSLLARRKPGRLHRSYKHPDITRLRKLPNILNKTRQLSTK